MAPTEIEHLVMPIRSPSVCTISEISLPIGTSLSVRPYVLDISETIWGISIRCGMQVYNKRQNNLILVNICSM
jgi:hypothetical protein